MALRIAREEYYLPLPMSGDHWQTIEEAKECLVPTSETQIPEWVLEELAGLGKRCAARGLVVFMDSDETGESGQSKSTGHVEFSVMCGLVTDNGVQNIRMTHIEPVDFNLIYTDGKFYQVDTDDEGKPILSNRHIYQIAIISKGLLSKHGITSAIPARPNPFLFSLLIPKAEGRDCVKAFANELFHILNVIPEDETFDFGESNHYCGLVVDDDHDVYLIFFNHPEIFNYPEDSPAGRCAYGLWQP